MIDGDLRADALAMLRRGVPAAEVARLCGVSRSTVYRWKDGAGRPAGRPVDLSAEERVSIRALVDMPFTGLGDLNDTPETWESLLRESTRINALAVEGALGGDPVAEKVFASSAARITELRARLGV